ncbi:Membrane proteinase PrsW, cleaves anti-sigma factor RsiW, M82 family [Streptoalloteichus tenebrarius]|uniref:Membrane proteinase PrsW, cleaves anti-sigma factor RsiW, M82 family n=1 Tax=Streptoalloteichus tenebrarius (strain ATCC 17920 / DSM 40477 / JCM 4838 / CBS 697.72 / NBRC 16177 / NCIMB 11028 / NRRL B-12390 / A12253. 1 / ISP 5477) TaxID=1933 RepID=A0ABT1HQZ2_STRSD|nr:Membrane proteinase PrsW, cleaves anti-sigma factor RsiW, M82 family [Streptoalloteichus tenebrarius]
MLLPVVGMIALGVCGLVLLGVATDRVGLAAVLVGAAAAALPVGPVVGTFLWIDRWEPEPPKLMLLAFLWGACVATITSLLLNDSAQVLADAVLGADGGDTVKAVVAAPFVEEATKGVFVVALLWKWRQEFDGLVDGVVYAGLTAAGFAFTENIFYFGRAFSEGGFGGMSQGVVAVFVLRGVLAPFAHPLFTVMTGLGVGVAAAARSRSARWLAPLLGYLLAVVLHALWNGSATLGSGAVFINFYFLVMVPIFGGTAALVVWQRRREQRILAAQLPGFAERGWIPSSEVALLGSLPSRRAWRRAVRRRGGDVAARAVAAYQSTATELAFLRHRVDRGTTGTEAERRQEELLAALREARAVVVASTTASRGHATA